MGLYIAYTQIYIVGFIGCHSPSIYIYIYIYIHIYRPACMQAIANAHGSSNLETNKGMHYVDGHLY